MRFETLKMMLVLSFIGIHADIAEVKHAYWSSLAPLPLEVVLSAGQKAKDECSSG